MNYIFDFFKGILIGAGAILPGISSSVFCVVFGIYERLLDSVLYFFKNPKANIKFLLPIVLGVIVGVLFFSNILNYLLYKFPIQTNSIFVGLILGTIPSLIKDVNSKEKFKPINLVFIIIAFFVVIWSSFIKNTFFVQSQNSISFFSLVLSGICMSAGIVIPGISSTAILMLLGVYTTYISSISSLYFPVLIPFGIGIIIGSLAFMRLIKILFKNCYAKTFYTIIGFTLGSTVLLLPDLNFDISSIIVISCILLGFITSNSLTSFQKIFKKDRPS